MPVDTPVTTPDVVPTVAIPGLPLVHEPPAEASVKLIEPPMHTPDGPVIEPTTGAVLTVTMAMAAEAPHPVVTV